MKFGQYVRDDGPKAHLKKAGTPTMGGLIILACIAMTSVLYIRGNREVLPVLFATIGFGLIGFLDDYIKVVMKRSLGLTPWQKIVLQAVVAGIFVYYYLVKLGYKPEFLTTVFRRYKGRVVCINACASICGICILCYAWYCQWH